MVLYWDWALMGVAVSLHSVAILSTVFRLWYRWYTAHMWWDDAWAVLALSADIACLIVAILERPIPGSQLPQFYFLGSWVVAFAYSILMWSTRISILASIVRVFNPEGVLRRVSFVIGILFGIMGIALLAMRVQSCIADGGHLTMGFLIPQVTFDSTADVLLSVLPIWALRNIKLGRGQKVLIYSAFSASMVINIITTVQAVYVFQSIKSGLPVGSGVFGHVKGACLMIVCNMHIIVSFASRILHRGKIGSIHGDKSVVLTTVVLGQERSGQEATKAMSLFVPSGGTESSTCSFRAGGGRSNTSESMAAVTSSKDDHSGPEKSILTV